MELEVDSTIRNFRIDQKEGNREVTSNVYFYSLGMTNSVGYRVKSYTVTQYETDIHFKSLSGKHNEKINS